MAREPVKLLGGDEPRPKAGGARKRRRKKKRSGGGVRAGNLRRVMTEIAIGGIHHRGTESTEKAMNKVVKQSVGKAVIDLAAHSASSSPCSHSSPLPPCLCGETDLDLALAAGLLELTTDVCDRAHDRRHPVTHFLLNAAQLNGEAKPRAYPPEYMQGQPGHRVSFETGEELLDQAQSRLASMGLEVHKTGSVSQMAALAARKLGSERLRAILEQETVQADWVDGDVVRGERD